MASAVKLISLIFLTIVLLSLYSEFVAGQQQTQTRVRSRSSKVSSIKKKKIGISSTTTSTTATPSPSPTPTSTETVTTAPPEVLASPSQSLTSSEPSTDIDGEDLVTTGSSVDNDIDAVTTTTIETPSDPELEGESSLAATDRINQSLKSSKKPKTKKPVVRNVIVTTGGGGSKVGGNKALGCYECDKEECPTADPKSCPTGLVLDRCDCCYICGAGEGNRCWDPNLNLRFNHDIGKCGKDLSCKLRTDLEPFDPPEALCQCNIEGVVCGSDNVTYSSECRLKEAAHSNPDLVVASRLPCVSPPWVSNPVDNVTVVAGDEVALSCEVKGYPPSIIHWEFIEDDPQSIVQILPGDDSSVVVVVRGGPEKMTTTSWIQMISVNSRRQGKYFCVAKNSEGFIQSTGFVTVQKNND